VTCTANVLDESSGLVPIVIGKGTTTAMLSGRPGAGGIVVPLAASRDHWPWIQALPKLASAVSMVVISGAGTQLAAHASTGAASSRTLPHAASTTTRQPRVRVGHGPRMD
jgi:hypothetical protein